MMYIDYVITLTKSKRGKRRKEQAKSLFKAQSTKSKQ